MPAQTPQKSPLEVLQEDISSMQSQIQTAQGRVRLSSLLDEMEDLETNTNALQQRILDLRSKGYVFEKQLDRRGDEMKARWAAVRQQARSQISMQSGMLSAEMRSAEALMLQLAARSHNVPGAQPLLLQLKSQMSTIDSKISAAESSVRGMYDTYQQDLEGLRQHLQRVEWALGQVSEACFKLGAAECAVMAVKAVWVRDGKEDKNDPEGVLYLTDQRILFEQKEEIATKKVLFITTEKEKVQKLLVDTLIAHMESALATKQGLFKNEDHLELTFKSGAPFYKLDFHLDGQDSREWQALLGQVSSGQFDADRAVAPDQAAVERVRKAPSQCPSCGAAVTQPVLRGMETLSCQYCGSIMRLE